MKYFKVKKIKLLHNKHSYLLLLKQDNKKDRQPNKSFKVYVNKVGMVFLGHGEGSRAVETKATCADAARRRAAVGHLVPHGRPVPRFDVGLAVVRAVRVRRQVCTPGAVPASPAGRVANQTCFPLVGATCNS